MERTKKSWGEKNNIFSNDLSEVSVLFLKPFQRCSWHRHDCKYNLFYVLSGRLILKLEDGETEVLPGQIFTTVPGEYHEFQTRQLDTICIEVMYVKYDPHDIQRVTIGGPVEQSKKILYDLVCVKCDKKFQKNMFAGYIDSDFEGKTFCDECRADVQ